MPRPGKRARSASNADARPGASKRARKSTSMTYNRGTVFGPETKYFDTMFSADVNAATSWGSAVIPCTSYLNADGSTISAYTDAALIPSAIGNGYGQIVGNKYVLKKLKVRGFINKANATAMTTVQEPIRVRVMLIHDTQPNGAQLDLSTVLTDWGAGRELLSSFQAIASGSGGRVRILYDKFFNMNPTSAANNAGATTVSQTWPNQEFKISKTWKKGLKVMVKSGAATPAVASLSDVNIFLAAACYNPDGATIGDPRIVGVARAHYVD